MEERLKELAMQLEWAARLKNPTSVLFRVAAELRDIAEGRLDIND